MKGGDTVCTLQAGLPAITGVLQNISETFARNGTATDDSALYYITEAPLASGTPYEADTSQSGTMGFDASRCSQIYGTANTVQPPTISCIPQTKI